MSRQFLMRSTIGWLALWVAAVGCRPQQPFYFFEHKDMRHYLDVAKTIEYPNVQNPTLDDVQNSLPPLTLDNPDPSKIWELSLEETMKIALDNSKVFRSLGGVTLTSEGGAGGGPGGVAGAPTVLLSNPETPSRPTIRRSPRATGGSASRPPWPLTMPSSPPA